MASRCSRCRGPLYGLIPCPACRYLIVDEAVEEAVAPLLKALQSARDMLSWYGAAPDDDLIVAIDAALAAALTPEASDHE